VVPISEHVSAVVQDSIKAATVRYEKLHAFI